MLRFICFVVVGNDNGNDNAVRVRLCVRCDVSKEGWRRPPECTASITVAIAHVVFGHGSNAAKKRYRLRKKLGIVVAFGAVHMCACVAFAARR